MIKHRHEKVGASIMYGLFIILFQFAGACLGCVLTMTAIGITASSDSKIPAPGSHYITQLCPVNGCNDGGKLMMQAMLVEFMMTFLFVTFVLQIVKHNGAKDMPVNALAIGIGLFTTVTIASGISGGAINPAVGLIQSVFQMAFNGHVYPKAPETRLSYVPAYIVGPLFGGIFAGIYQRWINEKALAKAEQAKEQEIELTGYQGN